MSEGGGGGGLNRGVHVNGLLTGGLISEWVPKRQFTVFK